MPAVVLITPPVLEPITLAEAKEFLKVSVSDEDTLIQALITVARQSVETISNRRLIEQTIDYVLDFFPPGGYRNNDCGFAASILRTAGLPAYTAAGSPQLIQLPVSPVSSISSIQYVDTDGATQTLSGSAYQVDIKSKIPRLIPSFSAGTWPATRDQLNAVTIRFVAGYSDDPEDVPEQFKQAIRLLLAHWYENREIVGQVTEEIHRTLTMLMWQVRDVRFG